VDLEVEVRRRRVAGHPDEAEQLACTHRGADLDALGERHEMGVVVVGVGAVGIPEVEAVAAEGVGTAADVGHAEDLPVSHGEQRLALRGDDVDARV